MSGDKKKWSTPVLRELTPTQAVSILMTKHADGIGTQEMPQASAKNIGGGQEIVRLEQHVAELTESLAGYRELLAHSQSKAGASDPLPSTTAVNANEDYRPAYQEEERARRAERKSE